MKPPNSPTRTKPTRKPKGGPRTHGRLQRALDETVRREIGAALNETGGNVVRAAQLLGISQPGMYKRLTALGIDPEAYRG